MVPARVTMGSGSARRWAMSVDAELRRRSRSAGSSWRPSIDWAERTTPAWKLRRRSKRAAAFESRQRA
jgi:hypothetical protein